MYVVEAARLGNRENHTYVVGVYTSMRVAAIAALAEEYHRGGKYECYITQHTSDQIDMDKSKYLTEQCLTNPDELETEIDFIIKRSKAEFINE